MSFKKQREERIQNEWETLMGKNVQDPKNVATEQTDDSHVPANVRKACDAVGLSWKGLSLKKILDLLKVVMQVLDSLPMEGGQEKTEKVAEAKEKCKECVDCLEEAVSK